MATKKVRLNIEEQVNLGLASIPAENTDFQTVVDAMIAAGIEKPTDVITILKRRKKVALAVGKNEAGERYFHIRAVNPSEAGE